MTLRTTCLILLIASFNSAATAQESPFAAPPLPTPAAEGPQASPLDAPGASPTDSVLRSPPRILQGRPAPRRPSPPPSPFKTLFFENDFSGYVGQPPYVLGEDFKLQPFCVYGQPYTLSAGGQLRHRFHFEDNRLRPPRADDNTYQLWRWRNYVDFEHDLFRVYVESIDSDIFGEDLPALPVDRNRWDLLNAFFDVNLYENRLGGDGVFRYGRQELLYGAQRLVSPLDWSNTRRNFQGYKFFHEAENWRLDGFSVNPVNAIAQGAPADRFDASFDDPDNDQRFSAGWFTYTGVEDVTLDLYYLYLHDEDAVVNRADGHRHLVGGRWKQITPIQNACCQVGRTWDMEVQGGYQFGADNGQRVSAGFATAVAGHTWNTLPWSPRVAGLFWYGSGDDDPNDDENNTYFVYYPLAHAYWGIIDNLVGQNLLDYSVQLSAKPTKKLTLAADFHWFDRASRQDFVYNVAGAPLGTPGGSRDIGEEFDFVATYTVNPNLIFQGGYAYFWYGDFVDQNLPRNNAEFFYFQSTLNY